MSLPILKAIEQRLIERGLLRKTDCCYPLWFLAETERNLFLWRKGYSLREHERFEFWVDIRRLVNKRREALESSCTPVTPGCDTAAGDKELAKQEDAYLTRLTALLLKVGAHAHALSQVGAMVEKEIVHSRGARQVVVLPAPRAS